MKKNIVKFGFIGFSHDCMLCLSKSAVLAMNNIEVVTVSAESLQKTIDDHENINDNINLTINALERFDEGCFIKPEKHYLPQHQKHRKKHKFHN